MFPYMWPTESIVICAMPKLHNHLQPPRANKGFFKAVLSEGLRWTDHPHSSLGQLCPVRSCQAKRES